MGYVMRRGDPRDWVSQGDWRDIVVPVVDVDGSPLDFSGLDVLFVLATPGGVPVAEKGTAQGGPGGVETGDDGRVVIHLTGQDTATLAPGWYCWEAKVLATGGQLRTLTQGWIEVRLSLITGG